MAFCGKCGAEMAEGIKFCPGCGAPVAEGGTPPVQEFQYQQAFQQGADKLHGFAHNTADETGGIAPADIQKNKVFGGLAYFLFFLPLLACPDSKYGRFHANQGLMYLFLCIGGSIVNRVLTAILLGLTWRLLWLASIISLVVWLPILVIGIIGLINGFGGKAKDLPIIGKVRIIK